MKWRQGVSILSSGPLSEEGCRAMGENMTEESLGSGSFSSNQQNFSERIFQLLLGSAVLHELFISYFLVLI